MTDTSAPAEVVRGFWAVLDHIANFINALDTSEMTGREVRSAIYAECLSARPMPLAADALDAGTGFRLVPVVPTEEQWAGLARAIMMWLDMTPKTPRALFKHLERAGHEIPQWLRDDTEMKALDHVPSKGTRCYIIYRAMVESTLISGKTVGAGEGD